MSDRRRISQDKLGELFVRHAEDMHAWLRALVCATAATLLPCGVDGT